MVSGGGRRSLGRLDLEETRGRIASALALREQLSPFSQANDSCRLIFAEADALPGIVADRYNDIVILQLLAQGTAQPDLREALTETIREHSATALRLSSSGPIRESVSWKSWTLQRRSPCGPGGREADDRLHDQRSAIQLMMPPPDRRREHFSISV